MVVIETAIAWGISGLGRRIPRWLTDRRDLCEDSTGGLKLVVALGSPSSERERGYCLML